MQKLWVCPKGGDDAAKRAVSKKDNERRQPGLTSFSSKKRVLPRKGCGCGCDVVEEKEEGERERQLELGGLSLLCTASASTLPPPLQLPNNNREARKMGQAP